MDREKKQRNVDIEYNARIPLVRFNYMLWLFIVFAVHCSVDYYMWYIGIDGPLKRGPLVIKVQADE